MLAGGFTQGRELEEEEQAILLNLKTSVEERVSRQFEVFTAIAVKT